jgi:hypothetical protein
VAYSSNLKMEVTCSSETLVDFEQMIQHYILEDRNLYNHCCQNLEFYIIKKGVQNANR